MSGGMIALNLKIAMEMAAAALQPNLFKSLGRGKKISNTP